MTDDLKLLGCPFCGGEAKVGGFETESLWSHDIVPFLSIGCDGECDIAMQSEDHDGVRARWNTRAPVAQPPLPDAGEWVRALAPFMPIEARENQDYAEVTFGEHQTQAMSMAPNDWLVLNELYNRAMIASPPKQEGVAGWRDISTAPKDGTPIWAYCVHKNNELAGPGHEERWTDVVLAQWTDHNGGGWTWHGLCGVLKAWQPANIPHPPSGESR